MPLANIRRRDFTSSDCREGEVRCGNESEDLLPIMASFHEASRNSLEGFFAVVVPYGGVPDGSAGILIQSIAD